MLLNVSVGSETEVQRSPRERPLPGAKPTKSVKKRTSSTNVCFPPEIRTIYQRLDETTGKLIEAAGPGCTVLVIASHGMGPCHAGYHLLPEILARLGMGSDRGRADRGVLRRFQYWVKNTLPYTWIPCRW